MDRDRIDRGLRLGVNMGLGLPTLAIVTLVAIDPKRFLLEASSNPAVVATIAEIIAVHTLAWLAIGTFLEGFVIPKIQSFGVRADQYLKNKKMELHEKVNKK